MGTFGLKRYDTKDFWAWVQRSGYLDEYDFWSSLSGLANGTVVDHMIAYLTSLGYAGSPHDQFRQFLEAQVGNIGTMYDKATVLYEGTFTVDAGGGGTIIVDESGNIIVDENGNFIVS